MLLLAGPAEAQLNGSHSLGDFGVPGRSRSPASTPRSSIYPFEKK